MAPTELNLQSHQLWIIMSVQSQDGSWWYISAGRVMSNFGFFTFTWLAPEHIVTLWHHMVIYTGSTLAQVMACCLMAPSHYPNQSLNVISEVQWQSCKGNFIRDNKASNTEMGWKITYVKFHSKIQRACELHAKNSVLQSSATIIQLNQTHYHAMSICSQSIWYRLGTMTLDWLIPC